MTRRLRAFAAVAALLLVAPAAGAQGEPAGVSADASTGASPPAPPASASSRSPASKDLVEELRVTKERVVAAREALVVAEIAYVRGLSAKLPESEVAALAAGEAEAKARLDAALEPVDALFATARAEGVSPGVIRMYEHEIHRQR